MLEIDHLNFEVRSWRLEVRSPNSEVGTQKSEVVVGSRKSEVRSKKTETEVGSPSSAFVVLMLHSKYLLVGKVLTYESCICSVIDHEFLHNIVKVVFGSLGYHLVGPHVQLL